MQNHNKEIGYTRTDGRTHAGRTNTIFLVNGFKNPALRAGHKRTQGSSPSPEPEPRARAPSPEPRARVVFYFLPQILTLRVHFDEILTLLGSFSTKSWKNAEILTLRVDFDEIPTLLGRFSTRSCNMAQILTLRVHFAEILTLRVPFHEILTFRGCSGRFVKKYHEFDSNGFCL